jgi:hypothetical protein
MPKGALPVAWHHGAGPTARARLATQASLACLWKYMYEGALMLLEAGPELCGSCVTSVV